jgi:predicted hydrocarbon binding protein
MQFEPLEPTRLSGEMDLAHLRALMRVARIMDAAGGVVLGKGAPAVMYQSGRDVGRCEGYPARRVSGLDEALALVLSEGEAAWRFERWRDPGQEELWMKEDQTRATWLLFRRCPLLTLARDSGSIQGGLLCQALHGYIAGSLERLMGQRVEIRIGHCGPRACKILVEMKG